MCTTLAAISAAVLFIPSAFAVHATGIFQLDRDASQSLNTDSNAGQTAASEDWDNVCKKYAVAFDATNNTPGANVCHPSSATALNGVAATVALKSTFITDAFNVSDDVFKGGTDVGGIIASDGIGGALWQWKVAGAPDKSDIEQAFAAEYTCTAGNPPAGNRCSNGAYQGSPGHNILFFGGTRLSDAGDTNLGLWFLHNPVTECGAGATCTAGSPPDCPLTSGCGFTGGHTCGNVSLGHATTCNGVAVPKGTPGDIFVASAFTAKPTLQIYEYVGFHNASTCITSECDLQQVNFPVNQATGDNTCGTSATDNDAGCALINNSLVTSPWLFTDKNIPNGGALNTFGFGAKGGELFEGGLDLTALGFGNDCISTFMLNTRSSGSGIGSVDQDFAMGSVGGCTTTLTTSAASNANGLSIGTGTVSSGTDTATLTVQGVSTWGGKLSWYLCGPATPPAEPAPPAAQIPECDNTKGLLVTQRTVSNSSPASDFVSGTATLTQVTTGTQKYCWTAHFAPDTATAAAGVQPADDTGANECFTVSPVKPTLVTEAVEPVGLLSPTMCGGLADLNGDCANNVDPTLDNSTDFYGNTEIIGGKLDCNAWGAIKNAGTNGDGSITSGAAGTGDTCQLLAFDASSNSNVTINVTNGVFQWPDGTALPAIFPDPTTPNIHTIAGAKFAWSDRYGRVDTNGDEQITADDCSNNVVNSEGVLGANCGNTIPQGNGLVDLNGSGTITSADTCTTGCFLGHNVTNGFVNSGTVPFGSKVYDQAELSGTATQPASNGIDTNYPSIICNGDSGATGTNACTQAGGTGGAAANGAAAGGKITFTLNGPDNCTKTTNSAVQSDTNPQDLTTISGDGLYGPVNYTPGAPGTYHWQAQYFIATGDVNNQNSDLHNPNCTVKGEDVTVQQIPTTTKTVQSWVPNDTATVHATSAGGNALQGTVQFQLYPSTNCTGTALYDKTWGSAANPMTANSGSNIVVDTATTVNPATSATQPNTTAIHKADGATGGYPNVSWKVTFTPVGDSSHTGSNNSCDEQTVLTITDSP